MTWTSLNHKPLVQKKKKKRFDSPSLSSPVTSLEHNFSVPGCSIRKLRAGDEMATVVRDVQSWGCWEHIVAHTGYSYVCNIKKKHYIQIDIYLYIDIYVSYMSYVHVTYGSRTLWWLWFVSVFLMSCIFVVQTDQNIQSLSITMVLNWWEVTVIVKFVIYAISRVADISRHTSFTESCAINNIVTDSSYTWCGDTLLVLTRWQWAWVCLSYFCYFHASWDDSVFLVFSSRFFVSKWFSNGFVINFVLFPSPAEASVKGIKSFRPQRHVWAHPCGVIGDLVHR